MSKLPLELVDLICSLLEPKFLIVNNILPELNKKRIEKYRQEMGINDIEYINCRDKFHDIKKKLEKYREKTCKYEKLYEKYREKIQRYEKSQKYREKTRIKSQQKICKHEWNRWDDWGDEGDYCHLCGEHSEY
jgi:hypothetical protein